MCFVVHESCPTPLRAEKDIEVIKLFHRNRGGFHRNIKKFHIASICQARPYRIGALYRAKMDKPWDGNIDRGLHSYEKTKNEFSLCYTVIYNCIIPAGAQYYYNPDVGEYVSNRLIVKSKKS